MVVKKKSLPASAGDPRDAGWIPGLGKSRGRGNGNPLQYSYLGNPMEGGAWQATVHGVTESDMTEHTCIHTQLSELIQDFGPLGSSRESEDEWVWQ